MPKDVWITNEEYAIIADTVSNPFTGELEQAKFICALLGLNFWEVAYTGLNLRIKVSS